MNNKFFLFLLSILFISVFVVVSCSTSSGNGGDENYEVKDGWTFMVYSDADNNLEEDLLDDIEEMKKGTTGAVNIIVLVDRSDSYSDDSSVLGSNFTDTRLYRITSNKATRISGGDEFPEITTSSSYEANMGDAETLQKFIQFCKANYTADKYALIISDHGDGARSRAGDDITDVSKGFSYDYSSDDDCIYTAEVTDVLTSSESVDFLGFDVCLAGGAEVAYQYRPGNGGFCADVMVASAASELSYGWDYEDSFARITSDNSGDNGETDTIVGGSELYYDPSEMSAIELGGIFVEEQQDFYSTASSSEGIFQTLAVYDLSKIDALKEKVDEFVKYLVDNDKQTDFESVRGECGDSISLIHYFDESSDYDYEWIGYPYFDLYDLADAIYSSTDFTDSTSDAADIMSAVEDLIVYSYGSSDITGFENGKHGLSIFCPDGDDEYDSSPYWAYQFWYNSIDTTLSGYYYGKLAWCIDDQDSTADSVGNWFELLDSWYDTSNGSDGGVNGYQW